MSRFSETPSNPQQRRPDLLVADNVEVNTYIAQDSLYRQLEETAKSLPIKLRKIERTLSRSLESIIAGGITQQVGVYNHDVLLQCIGIATPVVVNFALVYSALNRSSDFRNEW